MMRFQLIGLISRCNMVLQRFRALTFYWIWPIAMDAMLDFLLFVRIGIALEGLGALGVGETSLGPQCYLYGNRWHGVRAYETPAFENTRFHSCAPAEW